jgi:hypothetical protein
MYKSILLLLFIPFVSQGEYILFEGNFENGSVILPRFRHWHDKKDGRYLGSDVIVSNLKEEKM